MRSAAAIVLIFAFSGGGWSRGQIPPTGPEMKTDLRAGWTSDLDLLADRLPKLHKNLFFKTTPELFRTRVEALKSRLANLSSDEFAVGLARIVASAADAHTSIYVPVRAAFPLMLYWFKEGIFIINIPREHKNALYGRITAVQGKPIRMVADEFASLIPCENDAQLQNVLPRFLASVEHLRGLGIIGREATAEFSVESETGETTALKLEAMAMGAGPAPAWVVNPSDADGLPLYRRRAGEAYWMELLPRGKTVYFKYNSCREMPSKPFAAFQKELLRVLAGPGIERLVIDLRNNGGGDSGILDPFIEALAGTNFGRTKGRLYVIIGRQTFSSAILNAIDLRKKTAAVFIGEPTGGKPNHYGEVRTFILPATKLAVSYSTKYFQAVEGDPATIVPDRMIAHSIADYRAKRDPFLEAILAPAETMIPDRIPAR